MSWTVYILIIVLTVYVAFYIWGRRHWYLAARQFKGPLALPIIGNAWLFICKNEEILMRIYQVTKNYKEPIRFWLGPMLLIVLGNPDHIEKILCSPKFAQKHDVYDFVKIYLGEGLVSGSGPAHKRHRRIIQPMLDLNFAIESGTSMQKHVDLCMDKLYQYVDKGTFDIHTVIHKCMVDIIKEIILGSHERSQVNGLNEFDQAMIDVYNFGFSRIVKPYLQPDFLFNLTPYKKKQDELLRVITSYGNKVIEESYKRRKLDKTSNEFHPIVDKIADFREDNHGAISPEAFRDHLLTLYAASEDTLTIISGFLSVCFGMYPEYQEKAATEIKEIFGNTPRSVTAQDITKLNYVDMCIKETLRLFPIAPMILRKCTSDFELENWLIPRGCAIVVPIFNVQRDKRFWDNPEHFYPDHFLLEAVGRRHSFAYVPFSAGPRGCIGKILANAGLKIFICNLLQRFEIEADGKLPDLKLKMDISTRPRDGYNVRLKKRVWK